MPELLEDGLPERVRHSRFDFTQWADGQAWRFDKGSDYTSSTETFRANVKKWAKANGYKADVRAILAEDANGLPIPASKADAIGLGVRFVPNGGGPMRR